MAEALSTYECLVLEQKWITHDPKMVAFNSFVTKVGNVFEKLDSGTKNIPQKKQRCQHDPWKFEAPKEGEPKEKVMSGKTYHWCHKEHLDGKPMWALHKPEDHEKIDSTRRNMHSLNLK